MPKASRVFLLCLTGSMHAFLGCNRQAASDVDTSQASTLPPPASAAAEASPTQPVTPVARERATTPTTPKANTSPPCFIGESSPEKLTIIFVHGIGGNAQETWSSVKTKMYWPEKLKADPAFDNANVFVHQYPTAILPGDRFNINELAENMRAIFDSANLFNRRMVFICHSMGGLVVRQFLIKYPRYAENTDLIYCFGTPTDGSHVAALGKLYKNAQLVDMITNSNGQNYLGNLARDWQAAAYRIPSYVGYETIGFTGVDRIVDFGSSSGLANRPLDPIDKDHITLVKPDSEKDTPYVVFANAYKMETSAKASILDHPTPARQTTSPALEKLRSIMKPPQGNVDADLETLRDTIQQIEDADKGSSISDFQQTIAMLNSLLAVGLIQVRDYDNASKAFNVSIEKLKGISDRNQPSIAFGFPSGPGMLSDNAHIDLRLCNARLGWAYAEILGRNARASFKT